MSSNLTSHVHECLTRIIPFISFSQPVRLGEPGFSDSNTPTKRRRHSSELPDGIQASGAPFGFSAQMAPPDVQNTSRSRYQIAPQDVGKEEGPYAVSDARSSYLAPDVPFASMQLLSDQAVGNRFDSRRPIAARGQDRAMAYAVSQMMDTAPVTANTMGDTPSSMQAASAAVMSAPTTRSTPVSGSTQTRIFDNRMVDNHPLHSDTRGLYDDIRDVSYRW